MLSDPTGLAPEDSPGYCVSRYGDCGIDPAVGGDIRGHYSDEQLSQKGVKRGQAASEEKRRQRNRAQATGAKRESPSFLEWLDAALPPFSGLGAVYHLIRAESPSEVGHQALDVLGYIPLLGEAADIANAGWYLDEGDDFNAALSAGAAIPFLGWAAAGAKSGKQALKNTPVSIGSPGSLFKNVDDDVVFTIPTQRGYRESSNFLSLIRADVKGCTYVTKEMLDAGSVHNSLFAGAPSHFGRGGYEIAVRPAAGSSFRAGEQPNELIHQGSLRFAPEDVVYAGVNPFG